jgi:hypothetical protein
MRTAAALLAALAVLAGPAGALAQENPLGPLPQAPPGTTPTVVVAPPTTSDTGGLQTWQQVLIFGAAIILLGGIAWAIVSDARNRAPVKEGEMAHPGAGGIKRNRSQKQRERARAKAKTGRAQRKRNRRR